MKLLEEKILKDGIVLPGNVLKVDNFLNHQLDVPFIMKMGREIACLFEGCGINKILTIESSGIAIAMAVAAVINVPVVFAKKNKTSTVPGDVYCAGAHSFTHKNEYTAIVSKQFLNKNDIVLIVDDFLAIGNALNCLIDILRQSGASLAGCAVAVEKGFQGGGDKLRAQGIRVESLALIDSMDDCRIVYRNGNSDGK